MVTYGADPDAVSDDGDRPDIPPEWLEGLEVLSEEGEASLEGLPPIEQPPQVFADVFEDENLDDMLAHEHPGDLPAPEAESAVPEDSDPMAEDHQDHPEVAVDEEMEAAVPIDGESNLRDALDRGETAEETPMNVGVPEALPVTPVASARRLTKADDGEDFDEEEEDHAVSALESHPIDDLMSSLPGSSQAHRRTPSLLQHRSAAVATEIVLRTDPTDLDLGEEDEEEDNEPPPTREELDQRQKADLLRARMAQLTADNAALLDAATTLRRQQETLHADNLELNKRVIFAMWSANINGIQAQQQSAKPEDTQAKVSAPKYLSVLRHVHEVRAKLREGQARAARVTAELRAELEERSLRVAEAQEALRELQRSLAENAKYARTGRGIPLEVLQAIEDFEADKERQVAEVRGSNIALKNKLARLQTDLRKRDELAEHLHVIDLEQLKVENQTLNEKIEERLEELRRLERKAVSSVELATHFKEKLSFLRRANAKLQAQMQAADQEVANVRQSLSAAKEQRDAHRAATSRQRAARGLLTSQALAVDYERRVAGLASGKDKLEQLRAEHALMEADVTRWARLIAERNNQVRRQQDLLM